MSKIWLIVALAALGAGCGADTSASAADLSAAPTDGGATLGFTVGGVRKALAAYYSFYVQPLNDDGPPGTYLVVNAVDPAFDCAHPQAGLDSLGFFFQARGPGATSSMVSERAGPDFVATSGGDGKAVLGADDDRFVGYDLDAGAVDVDAGGTVAGTIDFEHIGAITVDGAFLAGHCAALDFIVPD